ncbi:DUF349 domain-containing protein [Kineosporia rhizophila]|uniref:DUF349 domain-containing protein n=1 Tax=Kineosporia TaxID=49184 RepID=UPI001E522FB7|nr:DUF349 domain-containing protein [Kineosporia sp. NBRC 101677]MCE0539939.1 DUF349 domain-containing protein [Kineosporia rhizophila]GLY17346.1 hypothetical protein Kisp01_43610 [Kineosporia sp. NBRC 101677]
MTGQEWGRADEDGTVWVRTADGERKVGQYPGVSQDEALAYFVRKYEDLAAQVSLLEQRVKAGQVSPADSETTIKRLEPTIRDANAVGDLDGLLTRLTGLAPAVEHLREETQRAKQEARAAIVAERTTLVEEAEALAGADPQRIPWKSSGDRLRELFDEWRRLQKESRLDKHTEDELWKRFSHARTTFDRKRRHYFGALDEERHQAKAAKEQLIAEAEALSTSSDWGNTAAAYRDLMTRWKSAGRAAKKEDDALWARFRAAQDAFFTARQNANSALDEEFRGNLEIKEQLVEEAERLLPVTDIAAAKAALRDLQVRWDEAGKVPRNDMQRIEGRLRRVEQAVRDAEQDKWRRSNPEARARANDMVSQLERTIADAEADLAKAQASGNARKIKELEQSLASRRAWLEQAQQAMNEFTE